MNVFAAVCFADAEEQHDELMSVDMSGSQAEGVAEDPESASAEEKAISQRVTGATDCDYPEPRTAPLSNVRSAVLDIVTSHGPLTKSSIYNHYRDGCPKLERASKTLRLAVNSALATLERMKRVESRDEGRRRLVTDVVYHLPDQPWIEARPSLARDLDDVPLSELAAAILLEGGQAARRNEAALETVLKSIARRYGAQRFREQARERLSAAAELAFDVERSASIGGLR